MSVLACSDEFSETIEIGTLNPSALANEDGVNFLLTAAYSALDGVTNASGGWEATGDNWWMDVIADDAHKGSNDGDQQTLFLLRGLEKYHHFGRKNNEQRKNRGQSTTKKNIKA